MSHDTHSGHSKENKTIISFKNSFWLIIILVGLFIAALNFVQAESGAEEGEGHEGAKTEATHETTKGGHEAAKEGEKKEEHAEASKTEAPKTEAAPAAAETEHKSGH